MKIISIEYTIYMAWENISKIEDNPPDPQPCPLVEAFIIKSSHQKVIF